MKTLNRQEILHEIENELNNSNKKFSKFNSYHEGYAVIKEEVDELWDEIKKKPYKIERYKLRAEAIQVAAMAVKFIESFNL